MYLQITRVKQHNLKYWLHFFQAIKIVQAATMQSVVCSPRSTDRKPQSDLRYKTLWKSQWAFCSPQLKLATPTIAQWSYEYTILSLCRFTHTFVCTSWWQKSGRNGRKTYGFPDAWCDGMRRGGAETVVFPTLNDDVLKVHAKFLHEDHLRPQCS